MQPNQLEWINNRIALLSAAEDLAMQDDNPKNFDENIAMINRCVTAKNELYNVKLMTKRP